MFDLDPDTITQIAMIKAGITAFYHLTKIIDTLDLSVGRCDMLKKKFKNIIKEADNTQPESDHQYTAYLYCKHIDNDKDMRKIIIKSGCASTAYAYCKDVSDDADMRQVIIDANNAFWAFMYCKNINHDPKMKLLAEKYASNQTEA